MEELTASHIHLPVCHITVVHPQMLGVGQRLLDRMEPFLKTVFRSGQADRDTALPPCRIFFYSAPLLEFDDQHQRLSRCFPFPQEHGVDAAANWGLIFQNQCQRIQSCLMQNLDQNRN